MLGCLEPRFLVPRNLGCWFLGTYMRRRVALTHSKFEHKIIHSSERTTQWVPNSFVLCPRFLGSFGVQHAASIYCTFLGGFGMGPPSTTMKQGAGFQPGAAHGPRIARRLVPTRCPIGNSSHSPSEAQHKVATDMRGPDTWGGGRARALGGGRTSGRDAARCGREDDGPPPVDPSSLKRWRPPWWGGWR